MNALFAHDEVLAQVLGLGAALIAGAALGIVYFGALGWAVRCFASGFAVRAVIFQLGRLVLIAAAMTGLAQLGAGPLIAGLLGLVLAREALLRRLAGAA